MRLFYLLLAPLFLLLSQQVAGINSKGTDSIVASIGSVNITADEFRLNYEFGFPHLKTGATTSERKKSYLNYMINEKILALYAEKVGIKNSESFNYKLSRLKQGILLQYFVEKEIKGGITVEFDEAKTYINKSKTLVQLELWSFSDLTTAQKMQIDLQKQKKRSDQQTPLVLPDPIETEYLSAVEIPSQILAHIQNLPLDSLSSPLFFENNYLLIKVKNIKRNSLTEMEYYDKFPTVRKILFAQKVKERVESFTDSLMSPKALRTDKTIFENFYKAIQEWAAKQGETKTELYDYLKLKVYDTQQPTGLSASSILISTRSGDLSVGELLPYLHFETVRADEVNEDSFKSKLKEIIGLSVRDYYIEQLVVSKGYLKENDVQHEIKKWEDKLAFSELRDSIAGELKALRVVNTELENLVNQQKTNFPVTINYDVLESIEVVESEKSKNQYYSIFVSGINRLAQPIVDGFWKIPN